MIGEKFNNEFAIKSTLMAIYVYEGLDESSWLTLSSGQMDDRIKSFDLYEFNDDPYFVHAFLIVEGMIPSFKELVAKGFYFRNFDDVADMLKSGTFEVDSEMYESSDSCTYVQESFRLVR